MARVIIWTAQQLVSFSDWLGNAYGAGMNFARAKVYGQVWNSETLVHFGEAMTKGYGPGL
jgi:hypothetical protein